MTLIYTNLHSAEQVQTRFYPISFFKEKKEESQTKHTLRWFFQGRLIY